MSRILQISDCHVVAPGQRANRVVDTGAALEDTVATINRLLPQIGPVDAVIVTGDLTDNGTPEEYARSRDILSALTLPWLAVPGNHDQREPMRRAFADARWMPEHGPIRWRLDLPDLAVLALDTLVEGGAHGALSEACLDWLAAELATLAPKPVLVALHHPPVATGILPMDRINLREADGLRRVLDAYPGERRLLCGHVHRCITGRFGSTPCQIAPGTSHAVTANLREDNPNSLTFEPNGMLLHEYRDGLMSNLLPIGDFDGPHRFGG
ncbi:calcineurin-like phosphoesterase family protein [Aliiruegeria haliotis]|uniref:Calcineurin-like phosphoesterase family protein n=1 Tax=Aliiruegeria haliotis TaxID=1280846 RepID=A0A2T0RY97_9RHOB|nr:phosphodiesterase [Aliiruegeria haliotis]PRY26155.1 calcineurin-like phosphoesterase family protein [Aliiruegeria haliotis]